MIRASATLYVWAVPAATSTREACQRSAAVLTVTAPFAASVERNRARISSPLPAEIRLVRKLRRSTASDLRRYEPA